MITTIKIPVRFKGDESIIEARGHVFFVGTAKGTVKLFAQINWDGTIYALTHYASGQLLGLVEGSSAKTERGAISAAGKVADRLMRRVGDASFFDQLARLPIINP